jgi:HK97 family phage portal protein
MQLLGQWLGSLAGRIGNVARVSSSILRDGARYWFSSGRVSGVFGGMPAAGIDVTPESAMTVATVYACTQARAETLASLPGMVYLELPSGARRRSSDNGLWSLLHDAPNPDMDSMLFYELLHMRCINRGNGFAEIVRDRNDRPVELWPIHNSRVEPFRNGGQIEWRISTDCFDQGSEMYRYYTIPDRDMLNLVGFNSNGYIGSGVIPCAVEEISANMAMTQYSASWFKKGAHPSAVVEHPKYIDDDDERAEFRRDINALHAGRENWHEVPVMWEGSTWKQIQYSPEQSQLISSKNYSDKTICRYYKVPPAIVQIFDDYKFSTVDAMIQQFVMTCIRTDAVRTERAIERKITKTRDSKGRLREVFDNPYVFEFVLEALLRGDAKKQAETLEIERRNGIINADEWRGLSNREPLADNQGEIYTVVGGFENLKTLGSTYPSGAAARNQNNANGQGSGQANASNSRLPVFDKPRLVQALENGVPKHRDRSPGASVADASTLRDEMDSATLDVLREAVGRIESIGQRELDKLASISSESERTQRTEAFWSKHASRMQSALSPSIALYCRYRECDPAELNDCLGVYLQSEQQLFGQDVTLDLFEEAMQ